VLIASPPLTLLSPWLAETIETPPVTGVDISPEPPLVVACTAFPVLPVISPPIVEPLPSEGADVCPVLAGATVVGLTVDGATVVGATVVGATVVGAIVVGATVVSATVVGIGVVTKMQILSADRL
jgi:hypothetical protein